MRPVTASSFTQFLIMNNRVIPKVSTVGWVAGAAPSAYRPQSSEFPNVFVDQGNDVVIVLSTGAWYVIQSSSDLETTKSNAELVINLANAFPAGATTTVLINDIKAAVDAALAAPSAWKTAYDTLVAAGAISISFNMTVTFTAAVTGAGTEANIRGNAPNFNGATGLTPFGQGNPSTTNWPYVMTTVNVNLATPADAALTLTSSATAFAIVDTGADVSLTATITLTDMAGTFFS